MDMISPGHWKASIPQPIGKLWMGFYGQIKFRGEHPPTGQGILDNKYLITTPGFVTPDYMPFPPCHGETCTNTAV